jgi:hypothetical protein
MVASERGYLRGQSLVTVGKQVSASWPLVAEIDNYLVAWRVWGAGRRNGSRPRARRGLFVTHGNQCIVAKTARDRQRSLLHDSLVVLR